MRIVNNFRELRFQFAQLLKEVDVDKISTVKYCRDYLSHLLAHKEYYLEIYADVFDKLIAESDREKETITLVEVGAGNGLMGIFAKYCGFNKVYINDIDGSFVDASMLLAGQLNIYIDGFIKGDVVAIKDFLKDEKPHAITGTDVIEHIYDLPAFFHTLHIINPSIVSIFTTASNPYNFFKVRQIKKLQVKDETRGGSPEDSVLFGAEPHKAYYIIRKEIIARHFTELNKKELEIFAGATRGMIEKDIIYFVKENYKRVPVMPLHSTNTCNPITGSWTERILTINEYREIYNTAGFVLKLYLGFYDEHKKGLKGRTNQLLNFFINLLGKTFAPYIILSGTKK